MGRNEEWADPYFQSDGALLLQKKRGNLVRLCGRKESGGNSQIAGLGSKTRGKKPGDGLGLQKRKVLPRVHGRFPVPQRRTKGRTHGATKTVEVKARYRDSWYSAVERRSHPRQDGKKTPNHGRKRGLPRALETRGTGLRKKKGREANVRRSGRRGLRKTERAVGHYRVKLPRCPAREGEGKNA